MIRTIAVQSLVLTSEHEDIDLLQFCVQNQKHKLIIIQPVLSNSMWRSTDHAAESGSFLYQTSRRSTVFVSAILLLVCANHMIYHVTSKYIVQLKWALLAHVFCPLSHRSHILKLYHSSMASQTLHYSIIIYMCNINNFVCNNCFYVCNVFLCV